jgi:hypothetical protein
VPNRVRRPPLLRRLLLPALGAALLGLPAPADAAPNPAPATLPTTDRIFSTIEDLVAIGPRRTGTEAGRRAASYVAERFRKAGLEGVGLLRAPSYDWHADRWGLSFDGQAIDAFPVSHSAVPDKTATGALGTGPDGIRAEMVDIGHGVAPKLGPSLKGKIAVFDLRFVLPLAGLTPFVEFFHDPKLTFLNPLSTFLTGNPYVTTMTDAVKAAQDAGAVGFVGILHDYFDSNRYHNEYYRRAKVAIPGMWVTKRDGGRLRAMMQRNPKGTGRLVLEAQRRRVLSDTVIGYLPGKTDDVVQIQSHHDSVGPGAVEDASGTAEVIALAEHFGAQGARKRQKTLMFTTFDTHFTGYQGHEEFARRYISERRDARRIVANVTIEHVGKQARITDGGKLQVLDQTEPRGIFENLSLPLKGKLIGNVVRNDLQGTAVLNGTLPQLVGGIPTDASFALISGIPTVSLIAGPAYMYDEQDTLDKIDKAQLRPVAQAFAELVNDLDPVPGAEIGLIPGVAGKRVAGDPWPLEPAPPFTTPVAPAPGPACVAAPRGRPARGLTLRPRSGRVLLRFVARRAGTVTVVGRDRRGRRLARRTVRTTACGTRTVRLPRGVVAVQVRDRRGAATARR